MNKKKKMSTRIIDETALRICFPKTPEIPSMITPEVLATSIPETIAATNRSTYILNTQGPQCY